MDRQGSTNVLQQSSLVHWDTYSPTLTMLWNTSNIFILEVKVPGWNLDLDRLPYFALRKNDILPSSTEVQEMRYYINTSNNAELMWTEKTVRDMNHSGRKKTDESSHCILTASNLFPNYYNRANVPAVLLPADIFYLQISLTAFLHSCQVNARQIYCVWAREARCIV